tara:strand:+ start:396 stop:746 length:351 start_codon:yes stop_codon:yes gene_type:complete
VWSKINNNKLSNCNYLINNLEVTSSNLVTPTKSPNFQTLCFLPFFKAQQGIETYLNKSFPITFPYHFNQFPTNYPLKCGYHVVSKKTHGYQFFTDTPIDILGVYAYILIINANIGE